MLGGSARSRRGRGRRKDSGAQGDDLLVALKGLLEQQQKPQPGSTQRATSSLLQQLKSLIRQTEQDPAKGLLQGLRDLVRNFSEDGGQQGGASRKVQQEPRRSWVSPAKQTQSWWDVPPAQEKAPPARQEEGWTKQAWKPRATDWTISDDQPVGIAPNLDAFG